MQPLAGLTHRMRDRQSASPKVGSRSIESGVLNHGVHWVTKLSTWSHQNIKCHESGYGPFSRNLYQTMGIMGVMSQSRMNICIMVHFNHIKYLNAIRLNYITTISSIKSLLVLQDIVEDYNDYFYKQHNVVPQHYRFPMALITYFMHQ